MLHYAVLLLLVGLFLSFVVPPLTSELQTALRSAQSTRTHPGSGMEAKLLNAAQRWLHHLPTGSKLIHPALSAGKKALEVVVGIFFTFAAAAYWIFERDAAVDLITGLVPRPRRKKLRDTWSLIEQKLGAFVRGQLLLVAPSAPSSAAASCSSASPTGS